MESKIRMIQQDDIAEVLNIYAPYIENTSVTFEYTVPTLEEFATRIAKVRKQFPWLVYQIEEKVVGYAYASTYRERKAYSWDCELSVYLSQEYRGNGIGPLLYERLLSLLKIQGYYNAYAIIASPNERSIEMHNKLGFRQEGIQKNVGYKFGAWRDITYMVKTLKDYNKPDSLPISIDCLEESVLLNILNV